MELNIQNIANFKKGIYRGFFLAALDFPKVIIAYIGYRIKKPNSKKIDDTFAVLITEDRAIPFGVLAQKAMYQAQK